MRNISTSIDNNRNNNFQQGNFQQIRFNRDNDTDQFSSQPFLRNSESKMDMGRSFLPVSNNQKQRFNSSAMFNGANGSIPHSKTSSGRKMENNNYDYNDYNVDDPDTMFADNMTPEQTSLFQSLSVAFSAQNVKAAVSVLRQVYTKQCRRFRIPNLLAMLIPETVYPFPNNDPVIGLSGVIFTINCIQFCFSGKRVDSSDSFKHKMNKNISRWLLKEQQRKGIPIQLTQEVYELAINVAHLLCQNASEVEFGMEILLVHHISNPKAVLATALKRDGSAGVGPGGYNSMAPPLEEAKLIEKRLLYILQSLSSQGVLGAHIPAIYKDCFGEQIQLYGRKLKDILLGNLLSHLVHMLIFKLFEITATNMVEMLGGENSPGGKRFRIRQYLTDENTSAIEYAQNERIRQYITSIITNGNEIGARLGAQQIHERNMSHSQVSIFV